VTVRVHDAESGDDLDQVEPYHAVPDALRDWLLFFRLGLA
jgi:hypothetical protein